jgi:hypothetical protein
MNSTLLKGTRFTRIKQLMNATSPRRKKSGPADGTTTLKLTWKYLSSKAGVALRKENIRAIRTASRAILSNDRSTSFMN